MDAIGSLLDLLHQSPHLIRPISGPGLPGDFLKPGDHRPPVLLGQ
jgi:hypothetical protein